MTAEEHKTNLTRIIEQARALGLRIAWLNEGDLVVIGIPKQPAAPVDTHS